MMNLNNSNNSMRGGEEEEDCDSAMKQESESIGDYSTGLPSIDDLTPLSQSLIPSQLASAFKITAETPRTMSDVTRASNSTFSSLNLDPKRIRPDSEQQEQEEHGKKRPRLVWTPQLHKRFVEVVAHLGLKNAVPKTIMQLMNVEGLTRENVASHLQKYRLYVKRMQENNTNDDHHHNPSDNLFASTPISQGNGYNESYNNTSNNSNSNSNSHVEMQMPMGMMGNGSGFYDGGNSLHHHHHYHHHYQQQYGGGNMGQQQNHYGTNAFSRHLAQK